MSEVSILGYVGLVSYPIRKQFMTTKCTLFHHISTSRHRHNRCNVGNFTGQFILVFELVLNVHGKQMK